MLIDYEAAATIMNRHIQRSGFGVFGVTAKEYTWEDEIRFAIDLKYLLASNAFYFSPEIAFQMDSARKYIPIGFTNSKSRLPHLLPMEIELAEVIVGKNISDSGFEKISILTKRNFTEVTISRK